MLSHKCYVSFVTDIMQKFMTAFECSHFMSIVQSAFFLRF